MARAKRSPLVTIFVWALVVVGAVLTGAAATADQFWLADMVTFFQPQLALGLLALGCVALLAGRWIATLALAAMFAYAALPLFLTANPLAQTGEPPTLRIASINVLFDHPDPSRLAPVIAGLGPDIIVAQEARSDWPQTLRALPGYPYMAGPELYRWNSNIVLSRYPMRAKLISGLLPSDQNVGGGRAMRLEIDLPDRQAPLILYAIHAPTPRTLTGWQARGAYLEAIAALIAAEPPGTQVVLAGDWNTPVWSPTYARMLQASGLEATERSAWPDATRLFWRTDDVTLVGTPIDHIAVSPDIQVSEHFLGPDFGSDHYPVVVDLKLP